MLSKASGAVMTRARAKYGRRLSGADFEALAGLQELHETAVYLRTQTHYAPYLEELANAREISRPKLESVLKNAFFDEGKKLCAFEKGVGESIFKYYLLNRETDFILDYIMNLSRGTPEKMLLKTPPGENCGTKIDLSRLLQITNAAELAKYLSKTKYQMLAAVLPKSAADGYDLALIEATLERIKYKLVFSEIENALPAKTAKLLCDIYRMRAELTDISMIYRAKRYYHMPEGHIRANLIGIRCLLSPKALEAMISSPTPEETTAIFQKTAYASKAVVQDADYNEKFCQRIELEFATRQIHFSSDPAVVLSAYLLIMQNECDNLIRIIEGITYRLPKDDILADLINV